MAKNFIQPGKVINFTNDTAAAITSGSVVVMGGTIGVALGDIAIGQTGSVAIDGVYQLPKVTTAVIGQGESINWDASAGAFDANTATPAAGDITGAAASAFEAGANGDTTIAVKLTGVPGTIA